MSYSFRSITLVLGLVVSGLAAGHGIVTPQDDTDRAIHFPDTEDFKTLVLDLHTHSVFSDGHVWPTIRVAEAERDGLDGLAITEHLEWQPHIADIIHRDRNRSYLEAARAAAKLDLMVIPGAEITRNGPPGHINAIFIEDANELVLQRDEQVHLEEHMFQTKAEAERYATESSQGGYPGAHEIEHAGQRVWIPFSDEATYFHLIAWTRAIEQAPRDVLRKANDQGAFVFWNHPSFQAPRADLNEFHAEAVASGLLQGVEVANGSRYYENAHRLALEKNLTLIGTSDIHGLIDWSYKPEAGGHRPVTLVFAKVKTAEAVKAALFQRRTVVWWKDTLIGREPELSALLSASVSVESAAYRGASNDMRLVLRNDSDAELLLSNQTDLIVNRHAGVIRLAANGTTTLDLSLDSRLDTIELRFEVMNALLAPREPATLSLSVETSVE